MQRVLSGLVVIVLALGLAACGDDDDSPTVASDNGAAGSTVEVTASGFAFSPTTADATAGTVSFDITNEDDTKHTFTIDDTDVDIQLDAKSSGSAEADLDAGTYEWHCTIHASMTGTLTVA